MVYFSLENRLLRAVQRAEALRSAMYSFLSLTHVMAEEMQGFGVVRRDGFAGGRRGPRDQRILDASALEDDLNIRDPSQVVKPILGQLRELAADDSGHLQFMQSV